MNDLSLNTAGGDYFSPSPCTGTNAANPSSYEVHRCELEKLDAVFTHHQFSFDEEDEDDEVGISRSHQDSSSTSLSPDHHHSDGGGDGTTPAPSRDVSLAPTHPKHRGPKRRQDRHFRHPATRLANTNVTLRFLVSCCKTLVKSNKYLLERYQVEGGDIDEDTHNTTHTTPRGRQDSSGAILLPPGDVVSPHGVNRRLGQVESAVGGLQRGREELADCTRRVDVLWAALSLVGDSVSTSPSRLVDGDGEPLNREEYKQSGSSIMGPVELLATRLRSGGLRGEEGDTPAFRVAIETSDRLGDVERVTGAQLKFLDRTINEVKATLAHVQRAVAEDIPLQQERAYEQQAHIANTMVRRDDFLREVERVEATLGASVESALARVDALEGALISTSVERASSLARSRSSLPGGTTNPTTGGAHTALEEDVFNLESDFDKLRVANAAYASHMDVELKTLRSELKNCTGMAVSWSSVIASNESIKGKMAQIERRHASLEKQSAEDIRGIVEGVVRGRLGETTDAIRALYRLLDLPSIGECIALSNDTEKLSSLQTQGQLLDEIAVNNYFTDAGPGGAPAAAALNDAPHQHVTFKEGLKMQLGPNVGKGARDYFDNKLYTTVNAAGYGEAGRGGGGTATSNNRHVSADGLVADISVGSGGGAAHNPARLIRDQNRRVLEFVHKSAPFHVLVSALRHLNEELSTQKEIIRRIQSNPHPNHYAATDVSPNATVSRQFDPAVAARDAALKKTFGYDRQHSQPSNPPRRTTPTSALTPAVGRKGPLRGITVASMDSDSEYESPRRIHNSHYHNI